MSRAPSLRPEHAALVRELRQAYPRAALPELAMRLGTRLGLGVSSSALHRFMQAHQVERLAWDVMRWPRDEDLAAFARKAKAIVRAQRPAGAAIASVLAVGYLEDLCEVFRALLLAHADEAGVPFVRELLDDGCRLWLAESAAMGGTT